MEQYGPTWRARRKAFHSQFQSQIVARYRPIEEKCTYNLLWRLLDEPDDFMYHIRQWVLNMPDL